MKRRDIPYRIAVVETLLLARLPRSTASIAIKPLDWPLAEEKRLFPQFTLERYFVSIHCGAHRYSISGVLEWGVFWYRLDDGEPQTPTSDALLWGTIDRLPSIVASVVDRVSGAHSRKPARNVP